MSSPPDPSQGSLFQPSARPSNVRVGPAGWHYKDWDGIVYPSKKSHSFDPLAFLADYVDTIEINSSFYHPPRPRDSASWAATRPQQQTIQVYCQSVAENHT